MTDGEKDAVTSQSTGSGQSVSIKMVGFDRALLIALALALSLVAILYADHLDRENQEKFAKLEHDEAQLIYFDQRAEAFMEQLAFQGYKVPPSLLNPPPIVKGERK